METEDIAIKVENLVKIYPLYGSPKDRLKEALHPLRRKYHQDFYALNDVSFAVERGEAVGVIGQNGSGKSTLLKIITGVLSPTGGSVTVNGRISSLLELGTGFNADYTGMENIFFYGVINGINRSEMEAKLDTILRFADIGDFIHQPVKTYSSGMFVRLAFACAIQVDPDILIIDEALSVGDAKFQKKCFDKMHELKERNTTLLLVSHDITTMRNFTANSVLLDHGKCLFFGDSTTAATKYYQLLFPKKVTEEDAHLESTADTGTQVIASNESLYISASEIAEHSIKRGAGGVTVTGIEVIGIEKPNIIHGGENIKIKIEIYYDYSLLSDMMTENRLENNLMIGLYLEDSKGFGLFNMNSYLNGTRLPISKQSRLQLLFSANFPRFTQGDYFISPSIAVGTFDKYSTLAWYQNLIHLKCAPTRKTIIGAISLDFSIDVT